jgi:ferredoxin--NADP+ reductase
MSESGAPQFPEVEMNLVSPAQPAVARVVSNDLCMNGRSASFVRHTVIDVSDTQLAGRLHAGQAFGVVPPGRDARGKAHKVRLYSLACPAWGEDGHGHHIATTTKRVIDEWRPPTGSGLNNDWSPGAASVAAVAEYRLFLGLCSNFLCGLRAGDEVMVSGPNGKRFLLPVDRSAHDYVFVATGTGIAPFRGMIMELLQARTGPVGSRIHLIAGSPYTTDLLYHREFLALQEAHDNFHYHTAISRESPDSRQRGRYVHHVLEDDMDTFGPVLADDRTLLYLCGIAGMEAGVFAVMDRHGLGQSYFTRKSRRSGTVDSCEDTPLMHQAVRTSARCMLEVY